MLGHHTCAALLYLWLLCARLVGGAIPAGTQAKLSTALGADMLEDFVSCESLAPASCDVRQLAIDIAQITSQMLTGYDGCRSGCPYSTTECGSLVTAMHTDAVALRASCEASSSLPGSCIILFNGLETKINSSSFDLAVVCDITGAQAVEELPTCAELIQATATRNALLRDHTCSGWTSEQCVESICGLYEQFHWRIKPSNLQGVASALDESVVLGGCEAFESSPFDVAACPTRQDVTGFCDCLCAHSPDALDDFTVGVAECPRDLDELLLLGRYGVPGNSLPQYCEENFCQMLGRMHDEPSCVDLLLPSQSDCVALSLPDRDGVLCPWLEGHSGEDRVLECLDSHRCDINIFGWDCCEDHLGRARCPRDKPVMCNTLVAGTTEYICGDNNTCTPRSCSVMLQPGGQELPEATTTSPAEPAGEAPAEEPGFSVGLEVVLLVLGFCLTTCCAAGLGYLFWWRRKRQLDLRASLEPVSGIYTEQDGDGTFHLVRPKILERVDPKLRLFIRVGELPDVRPLGLELEENKVTRVYPWGQKWGWEEGDVILSVAGMPVESFEEIWTQVQQARGHLPVDFLVERDATPEDIAEGRAGTAAPQKPKAAAATAAAATAALSAGPGTAAAAGKTSSPPGGGNLRDAGLALYEADEELQPELPALPQQLDLHDDVPPDAAAVFDPWALERKDSNGSEKQKQERREALSRWQSQQQKQAEQAIARKKKQLQEELAEASKLFGLNTTKALTPNKKAPKPEVRFVRDAWGRETMQYVDKGHT